MSSTKDILRTGIGVLADATGDVFIRMGLGLPGNKVQVQNTTEATGQAFEPTPKAFDILIEGIASLLGGTRFIDLLENDQGSTVSEGRLVYVSSNRKFKLATTATSGLFGITKESINNGEKGVVVTEGLMTVQLVDSLSPIAGGLLYASATPGFLFTAGPTSIGTIVDASTYAGNDTVLAMMRIPPI